MIEKELVLEKGYANHLKRLLNMEISDDNNGIIKHRVEFPLGVFIEIRLVLKDNNRPYLEAVLYHYDLEIFSTPKYYNWIDKWSFPYMGENYCLTIKESEDGKNKFPELSEELYKHNKEEIENHISHDV